MYLIIFSMSFLVMVMLLVLSGMRLYDNHKVEQIRMAINKVRGEGAFSEAMIQTLPEAVKTYFRHAIAPGTILASSVALEMKGALARSPKSGLAPMTAVEILTGRAFVWQGQIRKGLVRFQGNDMYVAKTSRQLWWFWNLVPWSVKHGLDQARFAAAHAGLGRIWLPSTLLPMYGVVWSVEDDGRLIAKFAVDKYPFALAIKVNGDGAVQSAVLNRWRCTGNKKDCVEERYGVIGVDAELQTSGYTIPSALKMGWLGCEDEPNPIYCPEIEVAQYQ